MPHVHIAYIDPGIGGIVLQMIVAGIVGIGYYFRNALRKLLRLLGGSRRSKTDGNPDEPSRGA